MISKTTDRRGIIEMGVAMILSGTIGFFVVESGQNAYNVVFFRCLFGAVFLAAFCFARGFFKNTGLTRRTAIWVVLGGVSLVFNWVLLFASYKAASISISTAIYHTQPFFLLIIGAFVLREAISGDKILWILLAFIGVLFTINLDLSSFSLGSDYVIGLCAAMGAAILYAIATMITKELKQIRPHLIALIQVSIGIILLWPFASFVMLDDVSTAQWGYLLVLGGIHTCFMYILMYSAFQKLPTTIIAVMSFIYPAVAILVDYFIYDISLSIAQFLGIGMILFSSFAVNQNLKSLSLFKNKGG